MIIIMNSWAWIEYFLGSEYGKVVRKYLSSNQYIVTPNIVLLEIASKYTREGFSKEEILKRLMFIVKKSDIAEFDYKIAAEAAKCMIELRTHSKKLGTKKKPGIADGLILAIARKIGGKILTGDDHFKGLPETIFIKSSNTSD
ncbi:MAG: PIN domain-containing protein [Candidatus Njordarchaeales archaeon]